MRGPEIHMKEPETGISDLPPSAKLVLKILEYDAPLTQKEIVNKTRLSQRTVRDALGRLQEHDIIEKNIYLPDARQDLYEISRSAPSKRPESPES
jgi:transcription initiation factor IIE alpha subunit